MLNGEPGIASDMLLSDRLLRNTQFRNYTTSWCSLLGVLAVVFYISYWLSQWLEYDDVNLKANSRELRCLLLSTQTAMSLAYVQNTFVHSPSTQATWGAVFFIADIILGLIALWAAVKEIVRISKNAVRTEKDKAPLIRNTTRLITLWDG